MTRKILSLLIAVALAIAPISMGTVFAMSISLTVTSGGPGTTTVVSATLLPLNSTGRVWFDSNGNNAYDIGEPVASVTTDGVGGAFLVNPTLEVPPISAGLRFIIADVPLGAPLEAAAAFTVTAPTITPPLVPATADRGWLGDIVITGTGFLGATSVSFGAGITVNSYTVNLATQITANITVAWDAALGNRTVSVTGPSGTGNITATGFVTLPAPIVSSTTPLTLPRGFAGNLDINGAGFLNATAVTILPADGVTFGTFVPATHIISHSLIRIPVTVAWDANLSLVRTITVTNATGSGTLALAAGFVTHSSPTITSVVPPAGARNQVITGVLINGTGFIGATAVSFGAGITVSAFTVTSSSLITVTLTIASDAVLGSRDVVVSHPGGNATLTGGFTVTSLPVVVSVAPNLRQGQSGSVIITGANFTGATAVSFGLLTTAHSFVVDSSTQITVWLSVHPTAAPGTRNVVVTTAAGIGTGINVFTVLDQLTITLTPVNGPVGTVIEIYAGSMVPTTPGRVWFDTNGNAVYDVGEPTRLITSTPFGDVFTSLTVPSVLPGPYLVRVDLPTAGIVENSAVFTVDRLFSLNRTSGGPGTVVTVSGSGFAASASGVIWFDTIDNGIIDPGETVVPVVTTTTGAFPEGVTIAVPLDLLGLGASRPIRADIPLGGSLEASASFTVLSLTLATSPASGIHGTRVTLSGAGYHASTSHRLYFDSNNNRAWDAGEPFVDFTTTAVGALPTGTAAPSFLVPEVLPGPYSIRIDTAPYSAPEIFSVGFTFSTNTITRSPSSGPVGTTVTIRGGGFAPSVVGIVWIDITAPFGTYNIGDLSASIVTSTVGTFTATIVIPTGTALGIYNIFADAPIGGAIEGGPVTFEVTAPLTLTLNPPAGGPGSFITVTGTGFTAGASGIVWFDVNGNSVYDAGEPLSAVITDGAGVLSTGITAPLTATPGSYFVRADIPAGSTVEISKAFTVLPIDFYITDPVLARGGPGTLISFAGEGFNANATGIVWLDVNGNNVFDAGEPLTSILTDPQGFFGGTILVPTTTASGAYSLRADIPREAPPLAPVIESSATFTVLPVSFSITPSTGGPLTEVSVFGSGFLANQPYRIYFDENGNEALDALETWVAVTANSVGALVSPLMITVPVVAAGSYQIRIDVTPFTAPAVASTPFTVLAPALTLTPSSGLPGIAVSVTGLGFRVGTSYRIYFDTNGNVNWDPGEPSADVSGSAGGIILPTNITVPVVTAGSYFVRIDTSPYTSPAVASATFVVPAAPTITASVSPASIVRGATATLTWTTTDAATLGIFPGIGNVPLSGSIVVSPTVSTIYIFTAVGPGGTVTANVTLTVTDPLPPPPPPLPTITASVSPASIVRGASATLTWSTTHSSSVTLFPAVGSVPLAGSLTVSPTVTTAYVFTVVGHGGTVTFSVTVTVTEPVVPRVVELRIGSTYYKVDGVTRIMDAAPYVEFGRTFVPVRFLVEGLGGTVEWDGETRTVVVRFTKPVLHIRLVIGEPVAVVGTTIVPIDEDPRVVPVIVGGRTFVPLRFLLDRITGSSIEWVPPDVVIMRLPR